jgi:hypothetical protein
MLFMAAMALTPRATAPHLVQAKFSGPNHYAAAHHETKRGKTTAASTAQQPGGRVRLRGGRG